MMNYSEMKYDTDFLCTYQLIDEEYIEQSKNNHTEIDDINVDDINVDDITNLCFQQQLLQVFGLKEYDGDIIDKITNLIFNEIKDERGFEKMIHGIREKMKTQLLFFSLSNETSIPDTDIFVFVFSYEFFHKFHKEYCAYKNSLYYDYERVVL